MNQKKLTLLCRVQTIIEREALAHFLAEEKISFELPERTMINNMDDQPNFSLMGYSILFDGYPVLVEEDHLDEAKSAFAKFQEKHRLQLITHDPEEAGVELDGKHLDREGRRFFQCTFWSMVIPVVFNIAALYWFFRSRSGLRHRPFLVALALAFNGLMIWLSMTLAVRYFSGGT